MSRRRNLYASMVFTGCFSVAIWSIGKIVINCFVMITSYFMCIKRITTEKQHIGLLLILKLLNTLLGTDLTETDN